MSWWALALIFLAAYTVAVAVVVAFFAGAFRATYVPPEAESDPDDWFDERV